ncbi:hypothetical protein ACLOJK_032160 [Asimina triloba]
MELEPILVDAYQTVVHARGSGSLKAIEDNFSEPVSVDEGNKEERDFFDEKDCINPFAIRMEEEVS